MNTPPSILEETLEEAFFMEKTNEIVEVETSRTSEQPGKRIKPNKLALRLSYHGLQINIYQGADLELAKAAINTVSDYAR